MLVMSQGLYCELINVSSIKPYILFVCAANIARSQMAETFFNDLSEEYRAISAGIRGAKRAGRTIEELSPYVVECMLELGYDVSNKTPTQLTPELVEEVDRVILMIEKETWPDYLQNSPVAVHWDVRDPKRTSYEMCCEVRDEIKGLVEELVENLT